jgi:hypothetical protein
MKKRALTAALIVLALAACTATPTITPTPLPTVTTAPTETLAPTPPPTGSHRTTPPWVATPTPRPTVSPTTTPTATPTATPSATPTVAPSATPTVAPTPVAWPAGNHISGGGFSQPAVAVDATGKVHIAATAADNEGIWYISNAGGSWVAQQVVAPWISDLDETGVVGQPAIAVDPIDGSVWIAFVYWRCIECMPNGSEGVFTIDNVAGTWSAPVQRESAGVLVPHWQFALVGSTSRAKRPDPTATVTGRWCSAPMLPVPGKASNSFKPEPSLPL